MLIYVITKHFALNGSCRVFLPLPLASHRSGSRKCAAYISEANFETHFLRRKEAAPAAGSVSAEREWYRNRRHVFMTRAPLLYMASTHTAGGAG